MITVAYTNGYILVEVIDKMITVMSNCPYDMCVK